MIKRMLTSIIPPRALAWYHFVLAWFGDLWYGHPSREMLVIGVTGTSGKSSTVYILRQLLEAGGVRVGALSTIEFYINGSQKLNDKKMTMLGRMQTQAFLRRMARAGCEVAIIETTSQAALQYRHRFINYDVMALTNLYPEHIEAHGGFENYKAAKLELFAHLARCARKQWRGELFQKTAVINGTSEYASEFARAGAERVIFFGKEGSLWHVPEKSTQDALTQISDMRATRDGVSFSIGPRRFRSPMLGEYTIMNIGAAAVMARLAGVPWETVERAVSALTPIPGHLELIDEGQDYRVIVDYAFEPVAMQGLYETVKMWEPARILHVLGSTGGGRDAARRFTVGEYVGTHADMIFVTDEDPYDTPPEEIMNDVARAALKAGKREGETLWQIRDRRSAIARACAVARKGDIVLITGKGCEQAMCVAGGRKIPWDDRAAARNAIRAQLKVS